MGRFRMVSREKQAVAMEGNGMHLSHRRRTRTDILPRIRRRNPGRMRIRKQAVRIVVVK